MSCVLVSSGAVPFCFLFFSSGTTIGGAAAPPAAPSAAPSSSSAAAGFKQENPSSAPGSNKVAYCVDHKRAHPIGCSGLNPLKVLRKLLL